MPYFYDTAGMAGKELAPGVNMHSMWGDMIMMNLVEITPGAVVPAHSHPNEQVGIVMDGECEFAIGGETRTLRSDDAYVIPGGVEHGVVGSDALALVLDIFSPPRENYKS